ncbi:ribulose phosphate epimerase [Mesorhizobium loti]|nr:polysaccharide deacetylase [Mesorhizobium loti]PLP58026.1 ribulose phosphate epimerase [Mesorhizobium loti]
MISNPVPWPNNARCAVAFSFDMDGESNLLRNFGPRAHTMIAARSLGRFEAQAGVPRILSMLARRGLRQTFFVPGWCVEAYPHAIEQILKGGHEIGHHGYLHEDPNSMEEDEEREAFWRGHETLVKATGSAPRGYRAPSYAFSHRTLPHLIEAGMAYDSSLFGDEVPYLLANAGAGDVLELPSVLALDDWTQYGDFEMFRSGAPIASPQKAMEVFRAEFEAAWTCGGHWIPVWHPFLSGRLSRCMAIDGLIGEMQERGGVWFSTLGEIAAHLRALMQSGTWSPHVEQLPFDQSAL